MSYPLKLRILRTPPGVAFWRWHRRRRGEMIGNYAMIPDLVARYAPGKSFADIGAIWGVNGEYAFAAERAGATSVAAVDVFGPTPEFERTKAERDSSVQFVLADVAARESVALIGERDVVLCAGVLYHHPSPFEVLAGLRRITAETLLFRSSTIPEMRSPKGMAVFWPLLSARERRRWNLSALGVPGQLGISTPFDWSAGYGNWFWGLTPTALVSLLALAGFDVEQAYAEPFAQTYVCRAARPPFESHLPSAEEARRMAHEISAEGRARPA